MSDTITDLTGTSWEFNILFNGSNFRSTNITFISNGSTFYSFNSIFEENFDEHWLDYGDITVYDARLQEWLNEEYRIIFITGGTDATNTTLISWLQSNATQIIEEKPISSFNELEVIDHTEYITLRVQDTMVNVAKQAGWSGDDLTGTTWTINSTTCSAGYGRFDVNFYINDNPDEQSRFYIGFEYDWRSDIFVPLSNRVMCFSSLFVVSPNNVITFDSSNAGISSTEPMLISWLQSNATLISW